MLQGIREKRKNKAQEPSKIVGEDFKHPDREKCEYEFEDFANLQDQLILKMKESGLSMRQCFGF